MQRAVVEASVRFRVLVIAGAAGLIVLGFTQLTRMPADVLPETAAPVVVVQTESLGLSAPEVEQLITVPLEQDLLNGVMGVESITSHSLAGLSSVQLRFESGTDPIRARALVQERLTQAFALPNVSKPPQMLQPVSSTGRALMIGLASAKLSPVQLSVLARWVIRPRLMGLPGVANVAIFGQLDRQLQVLVDPARLRARHVTLAQIINTTGNSQLVSPLSFLEASTPGTGGFIDGPNQRLSVRHVLPFGVPANLAQVPVEGVRGRPLRLGDVATVVAGHQPMIGDAAWAGRPGLVLVVEKLPGASTLAVTHAVDRALAQLRPGLPSVQIDASLFRPATYLEDAFSTWKLALAIGAVLASIVLLAFLRRLRAVAIVLAATAVSLVMAVLVLHLLGYSFNSLVVLGLVLALGVAIDDAVSGAVRPGSMEARRALGYATVIILVAAAPVFFSGGLTAAFLRPMVLAYALAVGASMVVALTLTPALATVLLGPGSHDPPAEPALSRGATGVYRATRMKVVRLPGAALLAVCAVGLAAIASLPWLSQPHLPTFKDRNLVVHLASMPGASLSEMDRITARVSDRVRALAGVEHVGAHVGRAVTSDQLVNVNSSEIWLTIAPGANYEETLASVRSVLNGTPGIQGSVSTYESDSSVGVLVGPDHSLRVRVYGQDYAVLARVARNVAGVVGRTPGVRSLRVEMPAVEPTVEVEVNLAAALRHGIKPGDVRREAATLLSGTTVGNFFERQRVFDVVVRGVPATHASLTSVRNLLLDTPDGRHVRLSEVARVAIRPNPGDIMHDAVSRYVDVTAQVPDGSVSSARDQVARSLAHVAFPFEYHAEVLGPLRGEATSRATFLSYVAAALLGILFVLQAALESWLLAVLMMLAIPAGLSGGVLVAVLSGNAGSLGSVAGLIAVLAIAVRQALSMSARTHPLREHDPDAPALAAAGAGEIGPALAAVSATAVALVPLLVLGSVAGNELTRDAAAVILGGLVTSTLINLLILPAVLARYAGAVNRSATHRPSASGAGEG
ncbi:MAG: efflux RND transporter permease subunit [Solirubrobacteraceae bacterium]